MGRPVIWQGAAWWVIGMLWGTVASAAVHHKSSHPEVLPARPAQSAEIGDSTKQPDTPKQPNPAPPIPPGNASDQKSNFEAVDTVAKAAIEAARHSAEESVKYYEDVTRDLAWTASIIGGAIGLIASVGIGGLFFFVKSHAGTIAEKKATSRTNALLNERQKEFDLLLKSEMSRTKDLLDERQNEFDSLLRTETSRTKYLLDERQEQFKSILIAEKENLENIETKLNHHIKTYDAMIDSIKEFQNDIANDLAAFVTVLPKTLELVSWISQNANKPQDDPTRVDPEIPAQNVLQGCAEALSKDPKENQILAYIYGYKGVAYRLLGKYDEGVESLSNSLKYNNNNANTLYNLACNTCLIGRMEETKDHLRRAIHLKPSLAEEVQNDPDFAALRTDPEFLKIVGNPA
jgi:tetratricopeptide (TPR) repeat protein